MQYIPKNNPVGNEIVAQFISDQWKEDEKNKDWKILLLNELNNRYLT
jgi:hypothetical protein